MVILVLADRFIFLGGTRSKSTNFGSTAIWDYKFAGGQHFQIIAFKTTKVDHG